MHNSSMMGYADLGACEQQRLQAIRKWSSVLHSPFSHLEPSKAARPIVACMVLCAAAARHLGHGGCNVRRSNASHGALPSLPHSTSSFTQLAHLNLPPRLFHVCYNQSEIGLRISGATHSCCGLCISGLCSLLDMQDRIQHITISL